MTESIDQKVSRLKMLAWSWPNYIETQSEKDAAEANFTAQLRIELEAVAVQGEPVATIHRNEYNEYRLEPHDNFDIKSIPFNVDVPLYTTPQPAPAVQAEPALTDDDIEAIASDPTLYSDYNPESCQVEYLDPVKFWRAIISAQSRTAAQTPAAMAASSTAMQPLTTHEIEDLWDAQLFHITDLSMAIDFARAIEEAHGIKGLT